MRVSISLWLGFLLGLGAITAAEAGELNGKSKTVGHVKTCDLYGAGFAYVPGTDICAKVGGWVRAESAAGNSPGMNWNAFDGNANNRTTSRTGSQVRSYITTDVRKQTEYGTVRAYISVGVDRQ